MSRFTASRLEISKSALTNNIRFLRRMLGRKVELCSVVKGNAYGHGLELFAPLAESLGIRIFGVYSADEAFRLRKVLRPATRVMVMGSVDGEALEWAIQHQVEFFTFGLPRLREALLYAHKLGKPALIHLEVETGMNRTGLKQHELQQALELISGNNGACRVEGLCSHFAGAESIGNYLRVTEQFEEYQRLGALCEQYGVQPRSRHIACSAALISYPHTIQDMVRVGILQYGFWPSNETQMQYMSANAVRRDPLKRVIAWKSSVMSIKSVRRGEFIGYGTSYLANTDMKIAVVPVGYSHGYSRSLSNMGRVLIRGKRLPVIGLVNMNALVVDVTGIATVSRGDEVVLIGRQGRMAISVASFSEFSNQLNYELLCRLPESLPRTIVD